MAHGGGGGDDFPKMLLIFLVVLFFVWLLTGGYQNESAQKPFITPLTDKDNPGSVYGPEDLPKNYREE
ncbi:MAG: hypothetical protein KBB75_00430 [Candidatus Pacebacteria bacterium]|jgi:hypothetical protein|nr:hypothetical protein [Candidatus Paceibacterota bacterium]